MNLRLHPEALAEALEAKYYLREDDPRVADEFVAAVEEALAKIREHPNRYVVIDGIIRKIRVGKFRYAVVYRLHNREVQVIAIMHLHRKPGYWKHREFD